ncbi:hypothetical protein NLJ89_g11088 [Agrocybe chaxingu]|uniref:Uncharacterized protein n=1 Tax=Agrocybe chaxingu TaxID=84603 RepID=A0A9W8JPE6_9AGAR|nr:hypothetical protein NLJ89_g11088 [Agrocybe chaxingu]
MSTDENERGVPEIDILLKAKGVEWTDRSTKAMVEECGKEYVNDPGDRESSEPKVLISPSPNSSGFEKDGNRPFISKDPGQSSQIDAFVGFKECEVKQEEFNLTINKPNSGVIRFAQEAQKVKISGGTQDLVVGKPDGEFAKLHADLLRTFLIQAHRKWYAK